jgi:hypothetical protein
MNELKKLMSICFLVLILFLPGCGASDSSDKDSGTAEEYPTQIVDSDYSNTKKSTLTTWAQFISAITSNFGSDESAWPAGLSSYKQAAFDNNGDISNINPITVTDSGYKNISNVVFYEYCNWYEPNSTLSITLSEINETSVSSSITTSLEAGIGYEGSGLSASISAETTKTVTTSKGIEVETSYDLTRYNQSKLYKVILEGSYICRKIKFSYTFGGVPLSFEGEGITVDQNSLAVKLVSKNR